MRALAVLVSGLVGCGSPTVTGSAMPVTPPKPTRGDSTGETVLPETPRAPDPPLLLFTDPAGLARLNATGLGFADAALGRAATSTAALVGDARYDDLVAAIETDLAAVATADPRSGVGMKHAHRRFDPTWLRSPRTFFELVGVVNRLDRRPFAAEHCGETRLIYRLAYETTLDGATVRSRLPMTVNLVHWQDPDSGDGGCRAVALRWSMPANGDPTSVAERLVAEGGPLARGRIGTDRFKSIEINVQSVRWPSAVRPDLGGHAEYVLRVFHVRGTPARWVPAPLENTPDVDALRADPARLARLRAWVRDPANLAAIDAGTALLPETLAATRVVSVTPLGLGRRHNRPFSRLLDQRDLADLALADATVARTPRALLRRLDGLSCNGCHETRSVAGFHLLGEDPLDRTVDALATPSSPHLDGELERRRTWIDAVVRGEPTDDARPLPDRELVGGAWGTHCGLGDAGFSDFACTPGLRCAELGDAELGTCVESSPGAGDPCQVGRTRTHDDPHRDRFVRAEIADCGPRGACDTTAVGFPAGMCVGPCDELGARSVCGAIPILADFNLCIGRKTPFPRCLVDHARPAALRSCDREHPCRDDYVCARVGPGVGACMPPYFLFQLRVDGHVLQ